jgi:hypothetical protein
MESVVLVQKDIQVLEQEFELLIPSTRKIGALD